MKTIIKSVSFTLLIALLFIIGTANMIAHEIDRIEFATINTSDLGNDVSVMGFLTGLTCPDCGQQSIWHDCGREVVHSVVNQLHEIPGYEDTYCYYTDIRYNNIRYCVASTCENSGIENAWEAAGAHYHTRLHSSALCNNIPIYSCTLS